MLSPAVSRCSSSRALAVAGALALAVTGLLLRAAQESAPRPSQTWAERLGYAQGQRVLILHCDDVGMCQEASEAARAYLSQKEITSAAAMAPCPWFNDFAEWARTHPDFDLGLHLTLTSEWKWYRWGPLAPRTEVMGLVDPDGYLWSSVPEVAVHATAAEVEREIRAQVERAISRGFRPTHLDTHMGTLYARLDFTRAYLEVAEEYKIPAMVIEMTPEAVEGFKRQGYPITEETLKLIASYKLPKLDAFYSVPEGKTYEEKRTRLLELLRGLKPGITEVIFHASVQTEGLRRITNSWQQRVWEAQLFSDPTVKDFLRSEGFVLASWKDLMARHQR